MKRLKSISIYLILAIAVIFCSCNPYYYAPNEGSLAALNEKNDLKVSVGSSAFTNSNESSFSTQIGYSPLKHLGLQASYFRNKGESSVNDFTGTGYIANAAIGGYYSHKLEKSETAFKGLENSLLFDFYLGYAQGQVNNTYNLNASSSFNFSKTFAQLGFHWQGGIAGLSYVAKFGNLDFDNGLVVGDISDSDLQDIRNIVANDTYDFIESSFRFHIGTPYGRVFFTRTWFNSSKFDKVRFLDTTFHCGLLIEIDELFKRYKK